tara:strand:- start:16550 stop:18742 length:2193 start_codon:yes stop_codon:yes gene_type:complete
MAYGVKYRLEFSDVLGYGKKVEILKKDYTGEILPMIGGAEPVIIKWNSSDDFYKPLIGSQCTLDLIVTDDVKYDDFYKFDEREFKVKISYSKSISKTYADRVTNDNGIYESLDCIDSFLGDFYTTSSYYNERVNNDNGRVESLGCVSNSIIDEKYNVWADYWVGFLVVDRFTERITSTPYNIRFNAFDGIGTLENFNAPLSTYNTNSNYLGLTDLERISKILQNLDLELDIVFMNDLNYLIPEGQGNTSKFPNSVTFQKQNLELFQGLDLYSAKKQLELLLSLYNMRIYQSFGKWCVVEVTNNFDTNVKDEIVDLNINQQEPENIRELITKRLNSINGEFISSKRYNYLGAFQATENISTVSVVPKQLKPIKNDLNREYLQPLQSVTKTLSTTQFDKSFYNSNPGFEYDLNGWNVISSRALIDTNKINFQGAKSIYLNASTSGDLECISSVVPSTLIWNTVFSDIKYQFSFYIDSTDPNLGMNIRFQIYSQGFSTAPNVYFNSDTGNWQSQSVINEIENFDNNQFVNVSRSLKNPFDDGFGTLNDRRYLQIKIFNTTPGQTGAGYVRTYFDNVCFSQESSIFGSLYAINQPKSTNIVATRTTNSLYSSNKKTDSILAPGIGVIQNWYRSRDAFLNQGENNYQTISNITNQSIMNDFREFCTRYSGTFRINNPTPLALINKLWFNWVNVLKDPEACIIDGMTYKVKSGEFNILSHLPNNDNDLNIEIKITN